MSKVTNFLFITSCLSYSLTVFMHLIYEGLICCFVCLLFLCLFSDVLHTSCIIIEPVHRSATITVQNKLVPTYYLCSS